MSYSESRWRNHAAPIIARVLAEHKDADAKQVRKALAEAYPYGLRKHHPYKIWCDEIKRQLGLKPKLGTVTHHPGRPTPSNPDPRQESLFDGGNA